MKVIRLIFQDDDGQPKLGIRFNKLGLRLSDPLRPTGSFDVAATTVSELIMPNEGVTCSMASVDLFLSRRERPMQKKEAIWEISSDLLPAELPIIPNELPKDPDHAHRTKATDGDTGHSELDCSNTTALEALTITCRDGRQIMIHIDEIRSALLSPVPSTALDVLVRRELAQYRSTEDIYSELVAFLTTVREWPFYTEEREEDFEGTLDKLFGACHYESRNYTIPKPGDLVALEGTAETISRLLAPLPPHDQLLVLNRAKDLVTSQIKIPA